jgi:hypothetical protein
MNGRASTVSETVSTMLGRAVIIKITVSFNKNINLKLIV